MTGLYYFADSYWPVPAIAVLVMASLVIAAKTPADPSKWGENIIGAHKIRGTAAKTRDNYILMQAVVVGLIFAILIFSLSRIEVARRHHLPTGGYYGDNDLF